MKHISQIIQSIYRVQIGEQPKHLDMKSFQAKQTSAPFPVVVRSVEV